MNDEKVKKIKIMCKELKNIKNLVPDDYLGVDYVSICALAMELKELILEDSDRFPVDIETIVEDFGVEIVYQPLNKPGVMNKKSAHKLVGTIFKMPGITGVPISCILIDSESKRAERRYALAHELAHYLLHYDEAVYDSTYYLMPFLFKDMEEMFADILAIFLLIPLPAFFDVFYEYIKVQNGPVQTSEWLKYLSIIANVSYEEVSIGYQNIRYVSGILYKLKRHKMSIEELGAKVLDITNSEKMKEIVIKQFSKIVAKMTDEMVELLYVS